MVRSKWLSCNKMKRSNIYTNFPVNVIVRIAHLQSKDSHGQERFWSPSAGKQICNYHREFSNHDPSLSTLRSKGFSPSKVKWWAIYTNLIVNAIVRIPHTRGRGSQVQETFLASSADKQTCSYDTECSNHNPSLSNLRSKGLSRSQLK